LPQKVIAAVVGEVILSQPQPSEVARVVQQWQVLEAATDASASKNGFSRAEV
jgi:hypothetical protein